MLDLSLRQARRKLKEFKARGLASLIHKLRGRPSNNQLDPKLEQRALKIIAKEYSDFGPTFAAEKLKENHGLLINHETLRKKMAAKGLWMPRKRRARHRDWRERKECLGELIQLDGSVHDWFEGRAPRCTLLAFIDDATSQVLHLEFADESTQGVMATAKNYFVTYGLPVEFYVDRGKVFKVNLANEDNERLTQFGRALAELGIKITYARSPQAKGRVERLFGTLQDRLVKELRLQDINTIAQANQFLEKEYVPQHNEKYALEPKSAANLHRPFEGYDLNHILSIKETRILTADFTLRYNNHWFQLEKEQKTILYPKDVITIVSSLDGDSNLFIRNTELAYHAIAKPVKSTEIKALSRSGENMARKPAANHPWKNRFNSKRKEDILTLRKEDILTLV